MKTPREILLARHQSAEPKLDAIREEVIASMATERSADGLVRVRVQPLNARRVPSEFQRTPRWREVLLSLRWHFAGLTAVWLLIALFNLDHTSESPPVVAAQKTPSMDQLVRAFRENRRQYQEIFGPSADEVSSPAQPAVPRRRSDLLSAARFLHA